ASGSRPTPATAAGATRTRPRVRDMDASLPSVHESAVTSSANRSPRADTARRATMMHPPRLRDKDQSAPFAMIVVAALGGVCLAAAYPRRAAILESAVADRPIQLPADGYASSRACRACHPSK